MKNEKTYVLYKETGSPWNYFSGDINEQFPFESYEDACHIESLNWALSTASEVSKKFNIDIKVIEVVSTFTEVKTISPK